MSKQVFKKISKDWETTGTNFLYFGDLHNQKQKPASRIDDFEKTELEKVRQVREIGKQYNIKAFIQPGDFLDKPKFDEAFLNKIMTNWGYTVMKEARELYDSGAITKSEFAERTLDYIPIIGTAGNHELFGGSLKTLPRTSLGFLSQTGFINLVDQDNPYLIKMNNGKTMAISGAPYDLNLLSSNPDVNKYMPSKKFGDIDLFLVHEALYDTQFLPEMNWMPLNKIWDLTKADITIAGHIHSGFGWTMHNDKIFGNPGVLAQQSVTDQELDRYVCVTLIHISDDNKIFVRDIPLDLQDPRDIFDLSYKDDKIELDDQLKSVKKIIDSVSKVTDTNAANIIEQVAKDESVPIEAKELAIEKTEKAMFDMGANNPLDPNVDYSISKIILTNFESHSFTEVDFNDDKDPTLLIGESSQGKSSVLRAIYWVLENQGDGKNFIRRYKGINSASVEIIRKDGTSVKRVIETGKTRSNSLKVVKNGWFIKYNDGTETEVNTEGLTEIQSLFGMNYLKLDTKETLPINFMKQEDGWYFIGQKAPQRAKVIGALYGTQYILSAIKELESNRRSLETKRKVLKTDIDQIKSDLVPLDSLELQKISIDSAYDKFETLSNMNSILEKSKVTFNDYSKLNSEIDNLESFIKNNNSIVSLIDKEIESLNTLSIKLENCKEFILEIKKSKETIKNLDGFVKNYSIINDLKSDIDNLVVLNSKKESLETSLLEYNKESLKCSIYEKIIKKKRTITSIGNKIDLLILESNKLNDIKVISDLLKKESLQFNNYNVVIKKYKKELSEIQDLINENDSLNSIKISKITLYNIKFGDNNNNMNDEIKKLKSRYDKVLSNMTEAQTKSAVSKSRLNDYSDKLKELGIDPKNADSEIKKLSTDVDKLYDSINSSLTKVEESYDGLEKE